MLCHWRRAQTGWPGEPLWNASSPEFWHQALRTSCDKSRLRCKRQHGQDVKLLSPPMAWGDHSLGNPAFVSVWGQAPGPAHKQTDSGVRHPHLLVTLSVASRNTHADVGTPEVPACDATSGGKTTHVANTQTRDQIRILITSGSECAKWSGGPQHHPGFWLRADLYNFQVSERAQHRHRPRPSEKLLLLSESRFRGDAFQVLTEVENQSYNRCDTPLLTSLPGPPTWES